MSVVICIYIIVDVGGAIDCFLLLEGTFSLWFRTITRRILWCRHFIARVSMGAYKIMSFIDQISETCCTVCWWILIRWMNWLIIRYRICWLSTYWGGINCPRVWKWSIRLNSIIIWMSEVILTSTGCFTMFVLIVCIGSSRWMDTLFWILFDGALVINIRLMWRFWWSFGKFRHIWGVRTRGKILCWVLNWV
jgi:hypothetical protein